MGTPRLDPLLEVHFSCFDCTDKWSAEPDRVEDAPELPWHPFRYFARCPNCGAPDQGQIAWERALMKAHAFATRANESPEARAASAAAGAKNLAAAQTPEMLMRTRFNALKHGAFAKTAKFFPAQPGKYAACKTCEHLNTTCNEADKIMDRPPACLKRADLYLQHIIAFEQQDPGMLMGLHAESQAAVRALIDDMILAIVGDGVALKTPKVMMNQKEGSFEVARYFDGEEMRTIYEVEAHPLLKVLADYLSKNSMSMSDLEMTPKARDEQEAMRGYLDQEGETAESARAFQERTEAGLDNLRRLIARGHDDAGRIEDAVIVEGGSDG